MAKIQELIDAQEDWKPGSLILGTSEWGAGVFFIPYYFCETGKEWFGLDQNNESEAWSTIGDLWEVYTEPRKKVKYYQWVDLNTKLLVEGVHPESEVSEYSNYIKIPGTEVELDE